MPGNGAAKPGAVFYNGRDISFDPDAATAKAGAAEGRVSVAQDDAAADFTPVRLGWQSLTFDVPRPKSDAKKDAATDLSADDSRTGDSAFKPPVMDESSNRKLKRVLHESNGLVNPGEMLAVVGSSGAGKSTLLNLIAGRIKSAKGCVSRGSVLINGAKRDFKTFKNQAAYVEQDDTMFGELTVLEQIRFAALLRLPSTMAKERKLAKVDKIIQELGLYKCRDTVIGTPFTKGVSGGERKRTSIGMELVTNPSLLLCDEPTSGLDSFSALNVMSTLRDLASRGRTVVATIHQPRSSIFAKFDKLCVLSEGRTVYFGPAADAATYFSSIGFSSPSNFNVADYIIDAVSIDYRSKRLETNTKKRVLYLAKEHGAVELGAIDSENPRTTSVRDTEKGRAGVGDDSASAAVNTASQKHARKASQNSWGTEFIILFHRMLLKLSRDRGQTMVRVAQTIFSGFLLGIVWLSKGRELDEAGAVDSLIGVLFFLCANSSFDGAFSVIFDFPLLRAVINRERAAGSYRISSYWLATFIIDIAKALVRSIIFVSIVYWLVGLRANAGAFLFAILCVHLSAVTAEGLSQSVSVFTGDAQTSAAVVPMCVIVFFLFAGFFVSPDSMPSWIEWFRYCSFLFWAFNALARNELGGRTEPGVATYLEANFNDFSRWANLAILFGFAVAFKTLYLVALAWKRPKFEKNL